MHDIYGSAPVGVVHIALKAFGLEPLEAFVQSYRAKSAGLDHDLLVVFKGFKRELDTYPFRKILDGLDYRTLALPDGGYDIGTYLKVIHVFQRRFYCFLNSKSVLLGEDWLAKLYYHAVNENVGLVGATGSFESLLTDHLQSPRIARVSEEQWRKVIGESWLNTLRYRYYYPPFPNPHLRTNAFMVRRELLVRVRHGTMRTKLDTSRFENGRRSISEQIRQMGLDVLVVGRDGQFYEISQWPQSGTFWQQDQQNLLVSDNQTEKYTQASQNERESLSRRAWGEPRSIDDVRSAATR